jgi:hypothetical protein
VKRDNTITLFMWGFQHIFRYSFQAQAERVFGELGLDLKPEALLVGVRVAEGATESFTARPALAVVLSEDGTLDVLPVLRRRVRRSNLETALADLHAMVETKDWRKWPELRGRLEALRFYFNAEQASQINTALRSLEDASLEEERFWVVVRRFQPAEAMDESYFEAETTEQATGPGPEHPDAPKDAR